MLIQDIWIKLHINYHVNRLILHFNRWLAYSDTDYKGEKTVLEENQSPCKLSATDVKSLRPLKMVRWY